MSLISIYDLTEKKALELDAFEFNEIEKAAQLCFLRKERFVGGYYHEKELLDLCKMYFSNTNILQRFGLCSQYEKMKEVVVSKNLIGLILIGINYKNTVIDEYPTVNNTIITLTVASICRILVRNYFDIETLHTLCKKTPNFNIYYKSYSIN